LRAGASIGAADKALTGSVGNLEALADGDVWLVNDQPLIVGGVDAAVNGIGASGSVHVTVLGGLSIDEDVRGAGDVALRALDTMTLHPQALIGATTVHAGTGNDALTADRLPAGSVVTLDGEEGTDAYVINFAGAGVSTINVFDAGVAGTDTLSVYGTPAADTI